MSLAASGTLAEELERHRAARRSAFYWKADVDVADEALRGFGQKTRDFQARSTDVLKRLLEETLGRPARSVSPLDSGTLHAVWSVEGGDGRRLIVRTSVPHYPYRAFDFHCDRWALGRLAAEGLPGPAVIAQGFQGAGVPFDYQVMNEAPGKPLTAWATDAAAFRRLAGEAGRFLAAVHAVRMPGYGPLDVGPLADAGAARGCRDSWPEFLACRLDDHLRQCVDGGALAAAVGARISRSFSRALPSFEGAPSALLHGDPSSANLFSDGKAMTALVDWEDAMAGDPVFEIAHWGTFIAHEDLLEPFLSGYRRDGEALDDFERRYALYHLRVVLAKTAHRRRFGYDRQDKIPAAARLERSWRRWEALL